MKKLKTIIFGIGYHGRETYRKCNLSKKKYKIICFVDNESQSKKYLFKKKIFKVNKVKKTQFDIIILSGRYISEQSEQLYSLGIKKEKILIWGKNKFKLPKKFLNKRSKLLTKMLKYLSFNFNKNKVNYWIDLSGLLALIRKQDLAEMSDVDISIKSNDIKKVTKILKKKNNLFNFNIKYNLKSNYSNKIYPEMWISGKTDYNIIEPPLIDFIVKIFLKKRTENLGKPNKEFPLKFFTSHKKMKYKNILLNIPIRYKNYLKQLYGNDWRKKANFWNEK